VEKEIFWVRMESEQGHSVWNGKRNKLFENRMFLLRIYKTGEEVKLDPPVYHYLYILLVHCT
jgi:hypothetical protein